MTGYVVRTSVEKKTMDTDQAVRSYKQLANVERANTCRIPNAGPEAQTFYKTTTPNPKQQQALDLLHTINV